MPPRLASVGIVLFWLAVSWWYTVREIVPLFRTGEPPPLAIDITEEATRRVVTTRWALSRNGERWATVQTSLRYQDSDGTYELVSTLGRVEVGAIPLLKVVVEQLESSYRVTRDGELRAARAELKLNVAGTSGTAVIDATVVGDRMERSCKLDFGGPLFDAPLEPVERVHGNVLNPMHPINRIPNLRPGQAWSQPLIDPLSDATQAAILAIAKSKGMADVVAPFLKQSRPARLNAEVLPELETVTFESRPAACHVIEYRGDGMTARVYVRAWDGLVIQQTATGQGETLTLVRE